MFFPLVRFKNIAVLATLKIKGQSFIGTAALDLNKGLKICILFRGRVIRALGARLGPPTSTQIFKG